LATDTVTADTVATFKHQVTVGDNYLYSIAVILLLQKCYSSHHCVHMIRFLIVDSTIVEVEIKADHSNLSGHMEHALSTIIIITTVI
jgi:hypothetical protein